MATVVVLSFVLSIFFVLIGEATGKWSWGTVSEPILLLNALTTGVIGYYFGTQR